MFSMEAMNARYSKVGDTTKPISTKRGALGSRTIDRTNRIVKGIVTMASIGIDGLIVPASALNTDYFWGPKSDGSEGIRTVYWGHDYNKPVGTCVRLKAQGEDLYCSTYITKLAIGDDLITMMEEGIVNGISSGFRAYDWSPPTPDEKRRWKLEGEDDATIVREALLLEYSIVAMPALPTAQIERMLTRGAIRRDSAVWFGMPEVGKARKFFPAAPVKGAVSIEIPDEIEV